MSGAFVIAALLVQEHDRRKQLTRERYEVQNLKNVAMLNDIGFKETFRLSRRSFDLLLNLLGPRLKQGTTRYEISVETKLLVAIRFLAQGSYQLGVGNDENLSTSKSSVSLILDEVVDVMNRFLCPRLITFPCTASMTRTSALFRQKYRIPGVIGLIDGTHVSIVCPKNDPEFPEFIYVNQKNFHSLNVQIICDHNFKIWHVNARFPGSVRDYFIWRQSSVRPHLLDHFKDHNVWLLGDSGYPLEPILIIPYRNAQPNSPEEYFNEFQQKCRVGVEQCIGILKQHWRCLKLERGLCYHPTKAGRMVNACVALHNFCIATDKNYSNIMIEPEDKINVRAAPRGDRTLLEEGEMIRQNLIGYMLQRD